MSKDKHLANIDRVLLKAVSTNSNLENKSKILFTEAVQASGEFLKVAFDVYRSVNDPYNGLWILEDINGKSHLVRSSNPQYEEHGSGDWTVVSSYDKDNVTLSYKKTPIARFDSETYKFSSNDIFNFKEALLENTSDASFIKDVLLEQPESKRYALLNSFPELKKFI